MYDVKELTTSSGDQDIDLRRLREFGVAAENAIRNLVTQIERYSNGNVLLTRSALDQADDMVLNARHIKMIFAEVAATWEASVPTFGKKFGPPVQDAFVLLINRYNKLAQIAGRPVVSVGDTA